MSFGSNKTATPSPVVAGVTPVSVASNQKAVPVPWYIGPNWNPLKWLTSKVLNPETTAITSKVGKQEQTSGYNYFGDLVGLVGVGLADEITGLEIANTQVWLGSIVRTDDPAHPDYWRAHISISSGDFYFYWGRADQPVDDIVLAPLAAVDHTQWHPAYRNQHYLACKRVAFGQSNTAPSIRVRSRRSPKPSVGTFPKLDQAEGESIVAGDLELLTNPIFGAAADPAMFTASVWQALSTAVTTKIGCHAPYLDRARAIKEIIKDDFTLFDGWIRLEGGKMVPGYFPHDGTVPAGITELSHHDIIGDPEISQPVPSKTINKVVVKFRNRDQGFVEDYATSISRSGARKKTRVQPISVDATQIIDQTMALKYGAERSRTNDDGDSKGNFDARGPRCVWPDGRRLQAGDNFNLDWKPYELDQVSRIAKIAWPYRGNDVKINYVAERGLFPTPYVEPINATPNLGRTLPTAILNARVFELTTQLAGTPLGIQVAYLAKRPISEHEESTAVKAKNVFGFNLYVSGAGVNYSFLVSQQQWAVRGVLRSDLAAGDGTAYITFDADNLDAGRITAMNADEQSNDRLLLIIGDEASSVGFVGVSGLNRDLSILRARQGTLAAAAATGAEVWLVYRSELVPQAHKLFVEDTTVNFKAQPFTTSAALDLADVDPLAYHFRDRADELPVIVIDPLPGGLSVGRTFYVSGQISDVNGDLKSFQINAAMLTGPGGTIQSETTLQAGEFAPGDKALYAFRAPLVFPQNGTWRIIVRAYDERVGFAEVESPELTVVSGLGDYGPDDGVTPDAITLASMITTGGLNVIFLEWKNPTNTPIRAIRIYESATTVRPSLPTAQVAAPQMFFVREGLSNAETRYFWLEVEAKNGRFSTITGPKQGITSTGIDLADLVPGMTMVGVVSALPPHSAGLDVVFLTTDKKLYRWDSTAGAWTRSTDGADLVANSILAGAISAGAITAAAIGANLVITNSANIGALVVNDSHMVNVLANKIIAGDLLGMYLKAGVMCADYAVANDAARTSTTATNSQQIGFDGTHRTNLSATEVWMVTFYGWLLGPTGYAENRFVRDNMYFDGAANGGATPSVGGWVDEIIIGRINGGPYFQLNPFAWRSISGNGSLNGVGSVNLTGLTGTDVVEFGILLNGLNAADQFNVCQLTMKARNI